MMSEQTDKLDWMTREQIADAIDVSPGTVTRLLRSGRIPAFKIGRQWRVRPADFESYLESTSTMKSAVDWVLERLDPLVQQGVGLTPEQVERIEELVRGGMSLSDAVQQVLRGDDG